MNMKKPIVSIMLLMAILIFLSGCTNQENPKTINQENPKTINQENPKTINQENPKTINQENPKTPNQDLCSFCAVPPKDFDVIRIPLGDSIRVIGEVDIQDAAEISCRLTYGEDFMPGEITKKINLDSVEKTLVIMHSEISGKMDVNKWYMCCTPGDIFNKDNSKTKCGS